MADAVFAEIKLAEGFEFLEEVDFDDVIIRGVEDLEVFEGRVLEAVKVMKVIVGDI